MSRSSYQIFVQISEARDLYALDNNNMSDPFVVVRIGPNSGLQRKTESKHGTVSAVWESKFMFEDVQLTDEEFRKEKLSISIYDRNDFLRNELIGSHEFSLTNIQRQKGSQYERKWFPVTLPEDPGLVRGYLLITTYVLRQGADAPEGDDRGEAEETEDAGTLLESPNVGERSAYLLNILVYNGQHILEHSKLPVGGSRNPFVTVRFNGNVVSTTHITDTTAPTWNCRLSLPFTTPLTSESIEVQLWNKVRGRPAQLISEAVFNYYNQGIAHKPWGPRWVNFYSSDYESNQVTLLGGIKSYMDESDRANPLKSEYVGRVMLRMSVVPVEPYNHRIQIAPCNPIPPPPIVEYCLDLLLYQALEIPVMGGQVKVEAVFGDKRAESSKKLGKDGVFSWLESLQPIYTKFDKIPGPDDPLKLTLRLHGPADLEQLHDIVITVYHIVGGSTRKVGFLRLKPMNMLPKNRLDTYFVNGQYAIPKKGMMSERVLHQMWAPRWYNLSHTNIDSENPLLVAGMLLMTIGFGITNTRPSSVPRPLSRPKVKYMLRAYIYQGANLLASDPKTISTNPFLVIRFGDVSYRTRTLYNTTYPFWCEYTDLGPISLDKEHLPCLFIQCYHQTTLQNTLIGRTDVLGQHVFYNNDAIVYRYQLHYDQPHTPEEEVKHASDEEKTTTSSTTTSSSTSSSGTNANMKYADSTGELEKAPYIMACFQLLPYIPNQVTRYTKYPLKNDWISREDVLLTQKLRENDQVVDEENSDSDDDNAFQQHTLGGGGDDNEEDIYTTGVHEKLAQQKKRLLDTNTSEETVTDAKKMPSYMSDPSEIYYRPMMAEYSCKLELVGLRNIRNITNDSLLKLQMTIPNIEAHAKTWKKRTKESELQWNYEKSNLRIVDESCVNLMQNHEWPLIQIPLLNPNGVVMKACLIEEQNMSDEIIGVQYVHLYQNNLIKTNDVNVVIPPFYKFRGYHDGDAFDAYTKLAVAQSALEEKLEKENQAKLKSAKNDQDMDMDMDDDMYERSYSDDEVAFDDDDDNVNVAKNSANAFLEDIGIDLQDLTKPTTNPAKTAASTGPSGANDTTEGANNPKTGKVLIVDEEEDDDEKQTKAKQFKSKSLLSDVNVYGEPILKIVDDDTINVHAEGTTKGPIAQGYIQKPKHTLAIDDEDEEFLSFTPPHSFVLMKGKQLGYSKAVQNLLQTPDSMYWKPSCVLRFYFTSELLPQDPSIYDTFSDINDERREEMRIRLQAKRQEVVQLIRDIDNLGILNDRIYSERYIARLAVYDGRYLAPRESFFTGNQTANPYLVVSNGPDDVSIINNRENYRTNTLHPEFYQSFQLQTELPRNNLLKVQVYNRDDFSGDTHIGNVLLDLEELLIERKIHGVAAYHSLWNDYSNLTQGKIKLKLDILTEDEARRTQIEDLASTEPQEYEIRMIIWSTRNVKLPDSRKKDDDVDQKIFVTTNFDGVYGDDEIKETDTAWYTSGDAEWNWRFVWKMKLPCLVPRIKISLWEDKMIGDMNAIAEINYNLSPLINQVLRDKQSTFNKPQHWVAFTHPNFPGAELGEVCLELWIMEKQEAMNNPVGEAQDEPNQNPYLPVPNRKPAPWQVGSRAINWMANRKLIAMIIGGILLLIIIILIIVVLFRFSRK